MKIHAEQENLEDPIWRFMDSLLQLW